MRRRRKPRPSEPSIDPAPSGERLGETAPYAVPGPVEQPTTAPSSPPKPSGFAKPNPLLGFGPQRVSRRSLFSAGLIADARAHFEARLDRPVSDDEARKFLGDLTDYFLAFKDQAPRQKGSGDD